jgi:fumarate reductase iron-sulfur subunit
MPDTITMQVTRYRPDVDGPPTLQEYVVPLREDWAVLDGLNYIKDQLDGTLSFRWSCRMGICGSCGMTVNGDPALTCGTFLTDYAPGPVRVEPLANFPVIRDLVVEIDDFMRKLPEVKPWLVREDGEAPDDVEFLQTPAEMDEYKQYSMCINCMLCYAACPVYGLEPDFLGPAAIALASVTTSTPATRAHTSGWTCWPPQRGSGPARTSASAPPPAPRAWTRPAPSSATS